MTAPPPGPPDGQPQFQPPRNTFVLCFDGTGNKFSGTDSDSNILKIYRMLDRTQGNTFHYYQPGIGTYVTSSSLEHTSLFTRFKSWYDKAKDSAVGTAFADHVMGGYRFLMRYYCPGDDIYFFGFSRGAYTARFLAEMLDHVGLLSAGNEELARFAWKTFAKWQARRGGDKTKEEELYRFMTSFRETFSRPVRRIRFLGLFDTVNSVPKFESAWMQRSKFPYTARSSAKVIRHAVSINERRAKFRQDLITGSQQTQDKDAPKLHRYGADIRSPDFHTPPTSPPPEILVTGVEGGQSPPPNIPTLNLPPTTDEVSEIAAPIMTKSTEDLAMNMREFSNSAFTMRRESIAQPVMTSSMEDLHARATSQSPIPKSFSRHNSGHHSGHLSGHLSDLHSGLHSGHPPPIRRKPERLRGFSQTGRAQDIEEVWFPGCHADIGGGWPKAEGETWSLSHMPLVWMVHEAEAAGLQFDRIKMGNLNCCPDQIDDYGNDVDHRAHFHKALHESGTSGFMHDCLEFGGGLPFFSVLSWKMMEYLPFRRMDLKKDGSWVAIRYPLPGGETRDIPDDAKIHNSAIRRLAEDKSYRPGNLIIGGGGRGVKVAPAKHGIGEWDVLQNEGDAIRGTYIRRKTRTESGSGVSNNNKNENGILKESKV